MTVVRYVLAAGDSSLGKNKKQGVEQVFAGPTEEAVEKYRELVGGSWTGSALMSEQLALTLVLLLKGNHRTGSYDDFAAILDQVELHKPCPVEDCGVDVEFVGWVSDAHNLYDMGDYFLWELKAATIFQQEWGMAAD